LLTAAREVSRGGTYEEVRRSLVKTMADRARDNTPSGNSAARRLERPGHYVDNATGALAELMRVGLVERATLPSTAKAAEGYLKTQFLLTEAGVEWIEMMESHGEAAALDALLKRLWRTHPQLADYLRFLNRIDMFFVPALPWSNVHPDGSGPEGRGRYVKALVESVVAANADVETGWSASAGEIIEAIDAYTSRREAFAAKRERPAYKRSRDFVRDCDAGLTVLALRKAGVAVDYISFEIIRRWTQDLLVANFSYWVPQSPSGFRAWSTATLVEREGVPEFARRAPDGRWIEAVEQLLPDAFAAAARHEAGTSFVPVWRVRAHVCATLHVNDVVFDVALRELQGRARRGELSFDLAFEVSTGGVIPPTERPFRGIPDRYGREPLFSLISIRRRRERSHQ
jgi:hypothetical protein